MVQSPPKPITLEEFLQLPETKPASEYFDGQIIPKPISPSSSPKSLTSLINLCLSQPLPKGLALQ